MESKITNLKDHYIICGAGENGYNAIKQFKKSKVSFIVIDKDEHKVDELIGDNVFAIYGDAAEDFTLEKAGLIVLSIKKKNSEKLSFNPSSDEILQEGDTMIVLGREDQVNQLKKIAKDL